MKLNLAKKTGIIILLIAMLIPAAVNASQDGYDFFENRYEELCSKEEVSGLVAFVCELRNERDVYIGEISQLEETISEYEQNIPEQIILFEENFDSDGLNAAVWDIYPNGGNIFLSDGILSLEGAEVASRFPFLQTKNVPFFTIPEDKSHISYEWRMRYDTIGLGTGLIFTGYSVPSDVWGRLTSAPYMMGVWRSGLLFNHDGTHFFEPIPTDREFHTYRVDVHGFYWYYYLDGQLLEHARAPSPFDSANSFFIGTPHPDSRLGWSEISVDYVKVTTPSFVAKLP